MLQGSYNPVGAQSWLHRIERSFELCAWTHLEVEEVESWWENKHRCLKAKIFLREMLLEDICNSKGIEFLKLKQGNRIVVDYAIRILNKDNKARVVHYKILDSMKDKKFSDQIKQGCIGRDYPNSKKELNSKDQSLQANQVKKFMREDVQGQVVIYQDVKCEFCNLKGEYLVFPNLSEHFIVYRNASKMSLTSVLMPKDLPVT
ncbi:hypothetical protein CR513_39133, partial [Mucuna pruriens]